MTTKRKLCAIKGMSEAKVDKVKEVAAKLAGVSKAGHQGPGDWLLTHCGLHGLVTPYDDKDLCQHWLR